MINLLRSDIESLLPIGSMYLDQVNSFPSAAIYDIVYFDTPTAVQIYSREEKLSRIRCKIRLFTCSSTHEQSLYTIEKLVRDVEELVQNQYRTVLKVDTDEGLFEPFCIGELEVEIKWMQ